MHCVYLIRSKVLNRTYIGYSTNIKKRLRQHNGDIKGGAKYTRCGRPWELVMYIKGFPSKSVAMQYEWKNHHPTKSWYSDKKQNRIYNRLKIMKSILKLPNFTSFAPPTNTLKLLIVFHDNNYTNVWDEIHPF